MAMHTRVNPGERIKRLTHFANRLLSSSEVIILINTFIYLLYFYKIVLNSVLVTSQYYCYKLCLIIKCIIVLIYIYSQWKN